MRELFAWGCANQIEGPDGRLAPATGAGSNPARNDPTPDE